MTVQMNTSEDGSCHMSARGERSSGNRLMAKEMSRLVCRVDDFDFLHCELNRTHEKPSKAVSFAQMQLPMSVSM
jgi:hypothetical protein